MFNLSNVFDLPSRSEFLFPLDSTINSIFDQFFGGSNYQQNAKAKIGYPKVDVGVEGGKFVVHAAVPGLTEKDLAVEVTPDNVLRISGQTSEEFKSPEDAKYWKKELRRTQFVREIGLPEDLTGEPACTLKNGVLSLSWELPKIEKPEVKKIAITTESAAS
jgi:HSP20 family molecular chaperone IbpA